MSSELVPSNDTVIVNEVILDELDYHGHRVVTFEMVAKVHGVPVKTIRNAYARNAEYFLNGIHTFLIKTEELQQFKIDALLEGTVNSLRVFTEVGYYMLIKPMRDRKSWDVQGEMAETYFKVSHGMIIAPIPPMPQLPPPLSLIDQLEVLREGMSFMEEYGLTDDHTRMIARESAQNIMRSVNNPHQSSQILLPEKSSISNYFQIEDLRDQICKAHGLKNSQWAEMRGKFGKVIRASIQAADPSAEPIQIKKMVNGAEREVNGWENGYRDIAIAAINQYLDRQNSI